MSRRSWYLEDKWPELAKLNSGQQLTTNTPVTHEIFNTIVKALLYFKGENFTTSEGDALVTADGLVFNVQLGNFTLADGAVLFTSEDQIFNAKED